MLAQTQLAGVDSRGGLESGCRISLVLDQVTPGLASGVADWNGSLDTPVPLEAPEISQRSPRAPRPLRIQVELQRAWNIASPRDLLSGLGALGALCDNAVPAIHAELKMEASFFPAHPIAISVAPLILRGGRRVDAVLPPGRVPLAVSLVRRVLLGRPPCGKSWN